VRTQDVKMNMRVRVAAGEYIGRQGHIITLPIPGRKGVAVWIDEGKGVGPAFTVDETCLEEVQHEQAQ